MNKDTFRKEGYVMPVIVLTVICLVVSGIMGYVNGITAPIIEEAAIVAANQAKAEIIPNTDFTPVTLDNAPKGVKEVAKANNGEGYVITVVGTGKNGDIKVMVGVKDGKVLATKCLEQGEDAGIGTKITTDQNFINQFVGKSVEQVDGLATISGATISSTAYRNIVKTALTAYQMSEGK